VSKQACRQNSGRVTTPAQLAHPPPSPTGPGRRHQAPTDNQTPTCSLADSCTSPSSPTAAPMSRTRPPGVVSPPTALSSGRRGLSRAEAWAWRATIWICFLSLAAPVVEKRWEGEMRLQGRRVGCSGLNELSQGVRAWKLRGCLLMCGFGSRWRSDHALRYSSFIILRPTLDSHAAR